MGLGFLYGIYQTYLSYYLSALLFACDQKYAKVAWERNYNSVKFKLRKKKITSKKKLKINKLFKMYANFVLRILCFDFTRFLKNYKEVPSTKCDVIMSL